MSLASSKQKHSLPSPPSLQPPNRSGKRFSFSSRNHLLLVQIRTGNIKGIHWRKPDQWIYPFDVVVSRSTSSVHKEERWVPLALCRFPQTQQNHKKRSISTSPHLRPPRFPPQSSHLHQNRPPTCVLFGQYCRRRRIEDCLPYPLWSLRMVSNAVWTN